MRAALCLFACSQYFPLFVVGPHRVSCDLVLSADREAVHAHTGERKIHAHDVRTSPPILHSILILLCLQLFAPPQFSSKQLLSPTAALMNPAYRQQKKILFL